MQDELGTTIEAKEDVKAAVKSSSSSGEEDVVTSPKDKTQEKEKKHHHHHHKKKEHKKHKHHKNKGKEENEEQVPQEAVSGNQEVIEDVVMDADAMMPALPPGFVDEVLPMEEEEVAKPKLTNRASAFSQVGLVRNMVG